MKSPILVVMAAGMGSRYGGLKQIDPVSENGSIIMDYSIYDAHCAGFTKVVFVIKPEMLEIFDSTVGERTRKYMQTEYAFQTTDNLPKGLVCPSGREKPLGTAHAVWCAGKFIDAPFAVINADDFYGRDSFMQIGNHLKNVSGDNDFAMVAYDVENTLTENGSVSRGVCTSENGNLKDIVERTRIEYVEDGIAFTEDDGKTYTNLDKDTPVSMNMWGFTENFINELETGLNRFFQEKLNENPLKGEYYLPSAVDNLIKTNKANVKVLRTSAKWFGVTYKEDKEGVVNSIKELIRAGVYNF